MSLICNHSFIFIIYSIQAKGLLIIKKCILIMQEMGLFSGNSANYYEEVGSK